MLIAAAAAVLYPQLTWAHWLLGPPAVLASLVRSTFCHFEFIEMYSLTLFALART